MTQSDCTPRPLYQSILIISVTIVISQTKSWDQSRVSMSAIPVKVKKQLYVSDIDFAAFQ
jgi:hypothetical protein